jgi:hypothetical protein
MICVLNFETASTDRQITIWPQGKVKGKLLADSQESKIYDAIRLQTLEHFL